MQEFYQFHQLNGGAVENLIDMILKENEITKKYDLTIYSIFDGKAFEECEKYKKCKFKFIDVSKKIYKLKRSLRGVINKLPNVYIGNAYITEIIKRENFENYDYVIVENVPEFVIPLYPKAKNKLILHLHNDRLNKNTKKATEILKKYNKVFTLSDYIGKRVKEISPLYNDKVYTLYNGIDTSKFGKEKYKDKIQKVKKEYGILPNDKVFLYTGRIVPEKGVKELVQAFSNLKDDFNVKLLITGSIDYGKNSTSKYLKEVSSIATQNIIFTGYIAYNEMPILYAIADVGIIPSIWEEPFALTVIEHMATGNPVIITNSGGMPELTNKKCAIMVRKDENLVQNLKEAIENVISNFEIIKNMGIEARKQSESFDKSNYVSRFNKLIEETKENE